MSILKAISTRNESKIGFILKGSDYRFLLAKQEDPKLTDDELSTIFNCNNSLVSLSRKRLAKFGLVI